MDEEYLCTDLQRFLFKMPKKSLKKNANLFRGESNPFNIKVNRRKHPVLGLKVKGTKGLPGVSKAVSYAKRKELWEKSKIHSKKSNRYFDKRLLDPSMPLEDRVTARFVRERQKKARNIFNLNDDEELTHKGQPLQNIQHFDDLECGSDEEEDKLASTFVSKAHFGGFASETNFEKPKTHKELIEQLIIESKLKKQEKRIEKEKYINFQEMVDKEWKEISLRSTTNSSYISNPIQEIRKPDVVKTITASATRTTDMYDLTKVELKFEPKGSSISHGKTPEQLAEEEKKLTEKLEQERLLRMNDNNASNNVKSVEHLSADGIYDYFEYLQPAHIDVNKTETSSVNEEENSDGDESIDSQASSEISEPMNEVDAILQNIDEIFLKEVNNKDVLDIPNDIDSFRALVRGYDAEQVYEVIDNMLKNTIRSKNEKILVKLRKFFGILMQYALECCEGKFPSVDKTGILSPHLQSLASISTNSSAKIFLNILDQERQIFKECKKQNMKQDFPRFQTLVVLKYSTVIFSASDFRHPVVTPAMIFMCDILSTPFNNTYINILSRLLVSKMILDCIVDSMRFLPEAICFLNSVLELAVPVIKRKNAKNKKFSLIVEKVSNCNTELDLFQINKSITAEDKVGIIFETVSQLRKFATFYSHLPSFREIFSKTLFISSKLPNNNYPTILQESLQHLIEFKQKDMPLCQLSFRISKPKPLKLFEPSFESKFGNDDINKKRKLLKNVSQKIKKEEKSMLREIRRDAHMIAAEKLKEKLESDAERKRKVKEIYGQLAMQEGEYKKMMKKKS